MAKAAVCLRVVALLLLVCFLMFLPLPVGVLCLVCVLLCITLCYFWLCNHLNEEERAVALICFGCLPDYLWLLLFCGPSSQCS